MITVGRVLEVRTNDKAQEYVLELPIFKNAGVTNNRLNDATFVATCCCDSGTYSPYTTDDIVYVGFVNNRKSQPVILGKVLRNDRVKPASYMYLDALKVDNNVSLPVNTSIQTTTGEEMSLMYLKQRLDEIDDLRNMIDNMASITADIKLYQHNLYIKYSYGRLYFSIMSNNENAISLDDVQYNLSYLLNYLRNNGVADSKHSIQASGNFSAYIQSPSYDENSSIIGVYVDNNNVLNVIVGEFNVVTNNAINVDMESSDKQIPSNIIQELEDTVIRLV